MPTIQKITSVAANQVSPNVLADEQYRFIPQGRAIRVQAKAAATGIKCTVQQGVIQVNDQDIPFDAANQFPDVTRDVLTQFQSLGGELFISHRNTTGAAISVVTKIEWK